jgi:membrane-associated phospholipid phosphatase
MKSGRTPLLAWPGWRLLGFTALLGTAVAACFGMVYGGTDYLTGLHHTRVRIHLNAELSIPFVPAAVMVYLSLNVLFAAAPFILRRRQELAALAVTLMLMIMCAGIVFLLMPAEPAFRPVIYTGFWSGPYEFARKIALQHNMVPSLHVAFAVSLVGAYASRANSRQRMVLWTWAGAIAISTLLTHQHHVLDVITGWALGLAGKHWVFDRWSVPRPTRKRQATRSTHQEQPV